MTGVNSTSLARQDQVLLLGALGGLVVLCWLYLIETSRGMAYRVALLPDNPHFLEYVEAVRQLFGIPEGQVRAALDAPSNSQFDHREEEQMVLAQVIADRELAGRWLRLHGRTMEGLTQDELSEGLTAEAAASARNSARIDLPMINGPEWMKGRPRHHPHCLDGDDFKLPLHRVTARLLEVHRLPHHICGRVQVHVLTLMREELERLDHTGVSIIQGPGEVPVIQSKNSFSVTIEGLDEYSTKAEWEQVRNDQIVPRQERFLERRGRRPQGRQAPDLARTWHGFEPDWGFMASGSTQGQSRRP